LRPKRSNKGRDAKGPGAQPGLRWMSSRDLLSGREARCGIARRGGTPRFELLTLATLLAATLLSGLVAAILVLLTRGVLAALLAAVTLIVLAALLAALVLAALPVPRVPRMLNLSARTIFSLTACVARRPLWAHPASSGGKSTQKDLAEARSVVMKQNSGMEPMTAGRLITRPSGSLEAPPASDLKSVSAAHQLSAWSFSKRKRSSRLPAGRSFASPGDFRVSAYTCP
jgi:hypothetical protein